MKFDPDDHGPQRIKKKGGPQADYIFYLSSPIFHLLNSLAQKPELTSMVLCIIMMFVIP